MLWDTLYVLHILFRMHFWKKKNGDNHLCEILKKKMYILPACTYLDGCSCGHQVKHENYLEVWSFYTFRIKPLWISILMHFKSRPFVFFLMFWHTGKQPYRGGTESWFFPDDWWFCLIFFFFKSWNPDWNLFVLIAPLCPFLDLFVHLSIHQFINFIFLIFLALA